MLFRFCTRYQLRKIFLWYEQDCIFFGLTIKYYHLKCSPVKSMLWVEQLCKIWFFFNISPNSFKTPETGECHFYTFLHFLETFFGQKMKYYHLRFGSVERMHREEHFWKIWWFFKISIVSRPPENGRKSIIFRQFLYFLLFQFLVNF